MLLSVYQLLGHDLIILIFSGTSNWAADYFEGKGTGVALVIKQKSKGKQSFISKMREIFIRDWESSYIHPLEEYIKNCVESKTGDYCESQKDFALFADPQVQF